MPGGRLTDHDRRHIASGLAEGLGYAEIARQQGRPTSTISREVARNGGPGDYRADHAHHATARRARRRTPVPPPQPPTPSAHGRDTEAVRGFTDQLTALMVATGLPRMASRVLVHLFITDSGSLTAAELVHQLRVSPASVSKAVAYLHALAVVRRERDPRQRRERYVIDDDVWLRAWTADAQLHTTWSDTARQGAEIFHATTPVGARLAHMSRFFAQLGDDMTGRLTAAALDDALTVLAALLHTGAPLTAHQLATALGWPPHRTASALADAEHRPDITDPVILHRTGTGAYTTRTPPDRLTAAQRDALSRPQQHP